MNLVLIDSRHRGGTDGPRHIHKFNPNPTGVLAAWAVVLTDEVSADDAQSYLEIAQINDDPTISDEEWTRNHGREEVIEACEVFNDYWAEYGWYLNTYDDDWQVPENCVLQS